MNIDMTKDTAVDWLITQIRNQAQNGTLDALVIDQIKSQAKEMEHSEIQEHFIEGWYDCMEKTATCKNLEHKDVEFWAYSYARDYEYEIYIGDK